MSKTWIILIAAVTGSLACVIWLSALAMQGPQWALLLLAVAAGTILGAFAGRAAGSRRWFYVGVPVVACLLAIAFTMSPYAFPVVVELGVVLIGGPAAALGFVSLYRRQSAAATVFLSIALFFGTLVPLQPLCERAAEAWSLVVLKNYCATLVPMLHRVRETTGNYPRVLNVPAFNEVETPRLFDDGTGGVLYTTDEKQFSLVVYRRKPPYRSQTYNSEGGRWVEGTHYPSSHDAHVMPSRTHVLTIDGSGRKTWAWR